MVTGIVHVPFKKKRQKLKRMKQFFVFFLFSVLSVASYAQGDVTGKWVTYDEETNKPSSHVMIEEVNGSLRGYIAETLKKTGPKTCQNCPGDKDGKPMKGLEIIWGFKKDAKGNWADGNILDPRNGKVYNCQLSVNPDGSLYIRGYWKFTWLGKTQTWYRK